MYKYIPLYDAVVFAEKQNSKLLLLGSPTPRYAALRPEIRNQLKPHT